MDEPPQDDRRREPTGPRPRPDSAGRRPPGPDPSRPGAADIPGWPPADTPPSTPGAPGWPPPPVPSHAAPPPALPPLATEARFLLAGAAFVLVAVLPTIVIISTSTSYDETATGDVSGGTLAVLVGLAAVAGLGAGALTFSAACMRSRGRAAVTGAFLFFSAVAGLCIGLVGAFAVTLERHPTWDDA